MNTLCVILVVLLVLVLWRPGFGFRSQKPEKYADTDPTFDIRKHLAGDLLCEGMIYGPSGQVVSRFVADFKGEWDGETGTLAEDFTYATGLRQQRKWFLTMGENGHFTATADDIIGEGRGVMSGATVQLFYRIKVNEAGGGHELDVVDWMYLMENGTIINRSEMRKFGIKVAELIASIRPVEDKDV